MRLYASKAPTIATEAVRALVTQKDIEVEDAGAHGEVVKDIESVLKSYLDTERIVDEKTRDLLEKTNRGQNEFPKVRQQIAEHHGIKVGDETLDYLLDQVVQMLMHSHNVEEVFAEDIELRRRMTPIFKKHMGVDSELDGEVRGQLKHLKEGTSHWDIEYAKVLETVKRKRGL